MDTNDLDQFTRAYAVCALWSSHDESRPDGGDPIDWNYNIDDIAPKTLEQMKQDCKRFQEENRQLLKMAKLDDARAGHCFWLTRNGHGSGFWDEYSATTCERYNEEQEIAIVSRDFRKRDALDQTCDCPYHACRRLSAASKAYREIDLCVGDDGKVYA